MSLGGAEKGAWPLGSGASLQVTQRVLHVPPARRSVAVVQVFDGAAGAFVEVMTRECKGYERMWDGASKCGKGSLYMMVWLRKIYSPSDIELTPLAQYEIGTKYTLQVHASAANGEDLPDLLTFSYQAEGEEPAVFTAPLEGVEGADSEQLYFKTGAYLQYASEEAPDEYGMLLQYEAQRGTNGLFPSVAAPPPGTAGPPV